ncbi:MAG: HD domain-containing protein [Sulfurimicrobium sp.]|nr:HD domain-containing protein [Sulfurimicrobium sp.]
MPETLRILLLEDSSADAELNEHVLRKARLDFTSLRVDDMDAFIAALAEFRPDIILADYHLPGFDGLQALAVARGKTPDTPFIFVTGAMGEELAVDSIKHGATDYIIKDRLARLPAAIQRAREEKKYSAQRREDERALRELVEFQKIFLQSIPIPVFFKDVQGRYVDCNRAYEEAVGKNRSEIIGKSVFDYAEPETAQKHHDMESSLYQQPGSMVQEWAVHKPSGETRKLMLYKVAFPRADGSVGGLIGAAVDVTEIKQAEERIRHLNRTLRTISACNEDLVRARNEEDLLNTICRDIVMIGGHLLAWVAYPSDEEPGATPMAHFGDENTFQLHNELDLDPDHARICLALTAQRERRTVSCNRMMATPECSLPRLHALGVEAVLALPLLNDGKIYGVLTVFSATPDAFDAAEVGLMEELAADLAYGIDALRTTIERDTYMRQFGQAMKNTVAAIARTLEMRDTYTAGHQQRVTALAVAIAREMGLEENIIEGLYFGGMIHDIGKIAVPAEILSKPAKLSKIEYMLIQTHAEVGYEIVKDIDFPWPVADMIVQHHERMDGSGYPKGLKGDEMLQESRILAVADVVEAMTSHRPYRPGLGIEAALDEIRQGNGSHYDPTVVEACIRVVSAHDMKLPQL